MKKSCLCLAKKYFSLFFLPLYYLLFLLAVICMIDIFEKNILTEKIPTKEDAVIKELASKENYFSFSCFGGKFIVDCNARSEGRNYCTDDFKKIIRQICSDLYVMGLNPLKKIKVSIDVFKVDIDVKNGGETCEEKIKEESGCLTYFIVTGKSGGYLSASIKLRDDEFKSRESLRMVLVHEFVHAFVAREEENITRIVGEFFSVYAQNRFTALPKWHHICHGEAWNRPVLASYSGNYPFPPEAGNYLSKLISNCRYGQLEYLARLLDKESPGLNIKLWHRVRQHHYGWIDTALLKKWIIEEAPQTRDIVNGAHIFKEANRAANLAIINASGQNCIFVYEIKVAGYIRYSDDFHAETRFFIDHWRGGKRIAPYFIRAANFECLDKKRVVSGDILHIKVTSGNKEFYDKFIVP